MALNENQHYLQNLGTHPDISKEDLVMYLDKGKDMLFFIEEDTFDKKDIQNVVFAIRSVIEVLKE